MKKVSKALLLILCAVMLIAASVLGTMAYLTSSDEVVNTFTYGKVNITLDETDVDDDEDKDDQVTINGVLRDTKNVYHLIPNKTYTKDPIVHVDAASEKCWILVKVENELVDIIAGTTIEDQMAALGWSPISDGSNVYAYFAPVDPSVDGADLDLEVFISFTVNGTETETTLAPYQTENKQIKVTAYAIQYEGFASAKAAWETAFPNEG